MTLNLRRERINHNWTQAYVEKQIGVSKQAIQLLESSHAKPSYDVLVKLEDLFNLPHRQLFAVVDDTPNLTQKLYHT